MPRPRYLNKEEESWLREHYVGQIKAKEMCQLMENQFGRAYEPRKLLQFCRTYQVPVPYSNQYTSGHAPWNKGKTCQTRSSTTFKKGHLPSFSYPIGTEKKKDGVWKVKISRNRWMSKARLLYQDYHDVTIDSSDYVIHLDGDKDNFDKDNLARVTQAELLRLNYRDVLSYQNKELTQTYLTLIKVKEKLRKDSLS